MTAWTRARRMVSVVGLAVVLLGALWGAAGWVAADEGPNGGSAGPAGEVGTLAVPADAAPGIYLAGDSANYDKETYHLDGGMRTFYWEMLEPNKGDYRWYRVDEWLAAEAAEGKKAAITFSTYNGRLAGGIAVPSWVWAEAPSAVVNIGTCDPAQWGCSPDGIWRVPHYWHSAYLDRYRTFINAFAERYRDDPRIAWIGIGVGIYGETKPCDSDDRVALQSAGLDSLTWVSAVNQITQIYVDAFSVGGELRKPLLLQAAPFFLSQWERPLFRLYAVQRGVGLSLNGLFADWNNAIFTNSDCQANEENCQGFFDQVIHYSDTVPIAFETYDYMLPTVTDLYWGLINGLDKHVDYFRLAPDLFMDTETKAPRPEHLAVIDWARKWVGASKENTPSVWVALREHREPYYGDSYYPQWGNYSFWLYQNDNIPGGQTVPEINDPNSCIDLYGNRGTACTSPAYNPNLGPAKEGWVTRRTDQGTGNPYMWFNVDNGYIYNETVPVTITVTYFDYGNDTWQLDYDSITGQKAAYPLGSGVPYVQKTDSRTWKQAVFVLSDIRFNDSLAGNPTTYPADFRIDCRSDGNEWVHFVEVAKRPAPPSVEIALHYGWNLISLPVQPATPYTAQSLLEEINAQGGSAVEVDRWLPTADWGAYILGGPFPDFPIELGKGYFVKCNAPSTWTVSGEPVYTPVPLSLNAGWNLIAIPSSDAYTAWSLFDAINGQGGSAQEIDRWYNGGWDITLNFPRFNNFPIEKGKAYFVKCAGSSTFVP
ncbi:MAG: beta-galactosidase [Anaerolineae bacterium]|nr:beta-galactosidase [Anaerolineae bacterium]